MESFLRSVAQYLYKTDSTNFNQTVLIVPNRRTGVILFNELQKQVKNKPVWSPRIQTINDFVQHHALIAPCDSIQLIAELYSIYKKISGTAETFDNFYNWGELLLGDFNDVDKYKVAADSVFINVKNFKSLETQFNYLSEEQLTTLKRFFSTVDVENLTKVKEEFLKIWEIMLPMYEQLKTKLTKLNSGYEGMIYTDALQQIINKKTNEFDFETVCFVGFNALTPVEEKIFEQFNQRNMAKFFWDFDDYYIENPEMEAGLFQRRYIKKFPPVDFNLKTANLKGKKITLVAAATNYGQVHAAAQILNKLPIEIPSETAIVLSDETLLLPVMNNIPANVEEINITMGYPLVDSLMGNFIESVILCHQNAKTKNNEITYFYKNILAVLNHPFTQTFASEKANELIQKIKKENSYQVSIKELNKHDFLSLIFFKWDTITSFNNNIELLFANLNNRLWGLGDASEFVMELEFGVKLLEAVKNMNQQLDTHKIQVQLPTYLQILRKTMRSITVPFEGEPISGIQIMGFLETRNLDFKNVIILSANEGMMPSPGKSASFIPFGLRKGFGLPTRDLNDAMYAYYFYRLIQRAENIWLVYNAGTGGMSSGEKSRFAYQLEYDPNFTVTQLVMPQTISVNSEKSIVIEKTEAVWNRLSEFLVEENQKKLSPSALSIYLQCPLRFYFRSVARIADTDEVDEVVDARIFGNIFHKAAELFYDHFPKTELITKEALTKLSGNKAFINDTIQKAFSQAFFGDKTTRKFEIEGKNSIVADVIHSYLMQMVKSDMAYTPFSIVGLEEKVETVISFKVGNSIMKVKIGGTVDRIDRTNKALRIIDYKTGSDKLIFKTLDDVFSHQSINDTKAIFQTFIYCYISSTYYQNDPLIKPMVYQVRKLFANDSSFEIASKECAPFANGNFLEIKDEVYKNIVALLEVIFNKNIPFTQTKNNKTCEYCSYKSMCGK